MKKNKEHSGVIIPMITPFISNGNIDYAAAERIIENLIKHDTKPFVLGTTGEAASISNNDKRDYIKFVCEKFIGKTEIYAGISDNSIKKSIENANYFFDLGVSVVVAHLPSYYPIRPSQMKVFYETLAKGINGKLMIYNIPATTHLSIPLEVIEALSYNPKIAGLKDSERDEERMNKAIALWKDRLDFSYLIGWGAKCFESLKKGADGIVPSTGNFSPQVYSEMYRNILSGNFEQAIKFQEKAAEISLVYQKNRILSESLPALKIMMKSIGLCDKYVLSPFTLLPEKEEKTIIEQLSNL